MALPPIAYWRCIDEEGMDGAGYYEQNRRYETSSNAVSEG